MKVDRGPGYLCACAIPDSFNVRPSDLLNPRCPRHGAGHIDSKPTATVAEVESCLKACLLDQHFMGRQVFVVHHPFGVEGMARELLARFSIQLKR